MTWTPQVGQRVRALRDIVDDLRDEGLPMFLCAKKGDELIVRGVTSGLVHGIAVSHESVTEQSFGVAVDEIELLPPNAMVQP